MVLSFTGVMKMKMNLSKRILVALLSCLLVQFTAQAGSYTSASQSGQQPQGPAAGQTPQELQQLVAPIALYPDALVAQILAASTRSEDHTSELQSRGHLVCRRLLEKKKK